MKSKTYMIAEIGSNHDGSLEIALEMVEKAKKAKADAVKFQTFQVDKLLNPLVFQENNSESNWVYDELKKVEIDEEFHKKIKEKCVQLKIDFISSPFDTESLEIVSKYCDKIKIASSEITNLPFLKEVGKYGKPVILSTGMSFLGEIEKAISALISGGVTDLSILHCISLYPLNAEDANLNFIQTLKQCFNLPVGFSDHSLDDTLALSAVSLGAQIIEKHVTLKREDRIFDHAHSMEFKELQIMIDKIRMIESALGNGIKTISAKEMEIKQGSNRSFFAVEQLEPGTVLTLENIKAVRPLIGIPVVFQDEIIGKKIKKKIKPDYPIFWEDIDW